MEYVILEPLNWICLKNKFWDKFIKFWMEIEEISHVLWNFDNKVFGIMENIFYYFDNSLSLHFNNKTNKLVYVEISYNFPIDVIFDSYKIFWLKSAFLIEVFSKKHILDKDSPELWYWYVFTDIELAFWRPTKPDDNQNNFWESDYEKWIYFSKAWIWMKGYFSKA